MNNSMPDGTVKLVEKDRLIGRNYESIYVIYYQYMEDIMKTLGIDEEEALDFVNYIETTEQEAEIKRLLKRLFNKYKKQLK